VSAYPEPVRPSTVGRPGRSAAEIRRDIELQRQDLGRSVEALRGKVAELTDWRRQAKEHQRELAIGAAVVGFAIGGLIAFRRRR
jgi:dienelactone hydrolase